MNPFSVVIAGGGVAALEGLLRLRSLAGDNVHITVLAPNEDFVYRALSVREPFSLGAAERHPLAPIVAEAEAELVSDTLHSVDVDRRVVHTGGGQEIGFDALLLAVGARARPFVPHATTFDDARAEELFRGVVQDIEQGYVKKVAFVNPAGPVWPLPLYELALMTARAGHDAGWDDLELHVVTAEPQPLPAFGAQVGAAVHDLLVAAGIQVHTSTEPAIVAHGRLSLPQEGIELDVDRIVAMPRLIGPSIPGIPGAGPQGFVPIDVHCAVPGTGQRVFAAGDAVDFPVKHGGVGAQAADVAAAGIAREAGLKIPVPPFHPVVHGKLLTGAGPKFLFARHVGGQAFDSVISDQPTMGSSAQVTTLELARYLEHTTAPV